MSDTRFEEDEDEDVFDYGKYRPLRVRGSDKRKKKETVEWDDD